MLDTKASVVSDPQYSTVLIEQNYCDTAPISEVELVSDILQCNNKLTTHMKYHKHPLLGNMYPCFQTDTQSEQER